MRVFFHWPSHVAAGLLLPRLLCAACDGGEGGVLGLSAMLILWCALHSLDDAVDAVLYCWLLTTENPPDDGWLASCIEGRRRGRRRRTVSDSALLGNSLPSNYHNNNTATVWILQQNGCSLSALLCLAMAIHWVENLGNGWLWSSLPASCSANVEFVLYSADPQTDHPTGMSSSVLRKYSCELFVSTKNVFKSLQSL